MDEQYPARPIRPLVILLLLLMVVALTMMANQRRLPVAPPEQEDPGLHLPVPLPAARGDEQAKVTVEVLYSTTGRCMCDGDTVVVALGLTELEPHGIRYTFTDTETSEGKWRGREVVGKPGGAGFIINGQATFAVPLEPPVPGRETVDVTFLGDPVWTLGDLWYVLDQAVREAGGKGLSHSRDDFVQQMTPLTVRLRDELTLRASHSESVAGGS